MERHFFTRLTIILIFGFITNSFAAISLTFQVHMGPQIQLGNFNPATDSVVVRGDFQIMAGDVGNWYGNMFLLTPSASNDSIYEITANLPDTAANQTIQYKYVMIHNNSDTWESIDNRIYDITADPNQIIPLAYFNNIEFVATTVNITFVADMTDLLNEGFVPGSDSIEVRGDTEPLNWGPGILLEQDLISPDLFTVTLQFTGFPGDAVQWKFHCDPADLFSNGGWEPGDNRAFTFPSADTTIGPVIPNIHNITPITGDNTVYFRVNMNNARERFNNSLITGLTSVWIAGENLPLQWPDTWTFSDTTNGSLIRMYDDGTHSDSIAGDNIFSNDLVFTSGTPVYVPFKYAAVFEGVDTLNGGSIYLDNESGYDQNHSLVLSVDGGSVYRYNAFGDQVVPVELTSFNASVNGSGVLLKWETATEINNRGFEIERSSGNNVFTRIGFVSGNGTSSKKHIYNFTDNNPVEGTYYYRLRQVDFDGSYDYSKTIEVNIAVPARYELQQNYPNPFNPATTISWQVPVSGWLTLKVYDILGKEVATIVNEYRQAGRYETKFNASNIPSGIYFYRLQSGNFVQTKKMILLK
jgi:hypothetical protein